MGIIGDFLRALAHLREKPFRTILIRALLLALALLAGTTAAATWALGLLPASFTLPLVGEVTTPAGWLRGLALGGMILASALLMFPVAALFVGFYLDAVADAVEARCYPGLEPPRRTALLADLLEALRFAAWVIVVNVLALGVYLLLGPLGPLAFWAVNGYLLGREYFDLVALRRLPAAEARRLRRRHLGTVWLGGVLVALLLSVPLVNLTAPMVGVAAFTHAFHRLAGRRPVSAGTEA